ncbi:MAG: sigma-E processing peptidase SpoIIGA [Firmicutes bacterium]|nr:sigma-E processing peptidase SpoIIGA [Bacillota bacterium]
MVNGVSVLISTVEMDWALLWTTAKVFGYPASTFRVTLGAIIGVLPTLWVLLTQNLYAVPWALGLLWPMIMVVVLFAGLPRRDWVKTYGLFMLLSLMATGLFSTGMSMLVLWMPRFPFQDWIYVVPILLMLMSWRLPLKRVRQILGRDTYGEVQLTLNRATLRLPVLWDSGNTLADPISRRPVVIVEMGRALDWIPQELWPWICEVHAGTVSAGSLPEAWGQRTAIIKFRTLTGEGFLPAVQIDRAEGRYLDRWYAMVPVMVGFSPTVLTADRSFGALASPRTLIHYPHERVGA